MKKVLIFSLILFTCFAHADMSTPVQSDPVWLTEVRASIKSGKFEVAIEQLQKSNQTTSAEWNNLMGYSLRQQKTPDLNGAENFYKAALKINPRHKGALEYYGMLRLFNNDVVGAEELLDKLDRLCFFGCQEYTDLKKEIKKYKQKK